MPFRSYFYEVIAFSVIVLIWRRYPDEIVITFPCFVRINSSIIYSKVESSRHRCQSKCNIFFVAFFKLNIKEAFEESELTPERLLNRKSFMKFYDIGSKSVSRSVNTSSNDVTRIAICIDCDVICSFNSVISFRVIFWEAYHVDTVADSVWASIILDLVRELDRSWNEKIGVTMNRRQHEFNGIDGRIIIELELVIFDLLILTEITFRFVFTED